MAAVAAGIELWADIEAYRMVAGGCIDDYSDRNEFTAKPMKQPSAHRT
jgi:hypothetical protein